MANFTKQDLARLTFFSASGIYIAGPDFFDLDQMRAVRAAIPTAAAGPGTGIGNRTRLEYRRDNVRHEPPTSNLADRTC